MGKIIEGNKEAIFKVVEGLSLTARELYTIDFICCNEDGNTIKNIASMIKKAREHKEEEPVSIISATMLENKDGTYGAEYGAEIKMKGTVANLQILYRNLTEDILKEKVVSPNMLLAIVGSALADGGRKDEHKR